MQPMIGTKRLMQRLMPIMIMFVETVAVFPTQPVAN